MAFEPGLLPGLDDAPGMRLEQPQDVRTRRSVEGIDHADDVWLSYGEDIFVLGGTVDLTVFPA